MTTKGEKKRQAIYEFIAWHIREKQFSPSLREIMQHVGIRSTSHMSHHLSVLEHRGLIAYGEGKHRTIRAVQP